MSYLRGSVVIGLALVYGAVASAQIEFDPERDVRLKAEVLPSSIPAGGSGRLVVELELPDGVHITGRELGFFFVQPEETEGVTCGVASFPSGVEWEGDTVYRGRIELAVPLILAEGLAPGARIEADGTVGYQICTEVEPIYCTAPIERRFSAAFTVASDGAAASSDVSSGGERSLSIEERARRALETGSLTALIWIFIGGILLSFTPCVYPIIPITIAYIGATASGSRLKGLSLSLVFVLGLALVYSALGVAAAATGGVFGINTRNPYVVGFVTLVFLVMGVGMLGAFDISLPASWQSRLSSKRHSGYLGALFIGGATGLVAVPCVGPVLVALLSWVSSTGNLLAGFIYLFVFACGLGMLFVVIGTFTGAVATLPRAGGWMERVKQGFGVVLIAAAFFFGKALVPEDWFTLLVGVGLLMLAGFLGGFSRMEPEAPLGRRVGRGVAVFVMLAGAFYVLIGLARIEDLSLFAERGSAGSGVVSAAEDSSRKHTGVNWIYDDEAAAFTRAHQTDRPVMIDFRADWCAACNELDHKTFSDPSVQRMVNRDFVPLKIDGSKITAQIKATWERYGVKGLPTVLFLSPDGEELARFEAFRTVEQVTEILNHVVARTRG